MNLYELTAERQAAIDALEVNPETGEVTGFEAFEALDMAHDDKLETYGIAIKNLRSDIKQLDEEAKNTKARSEAKKKKLDFLLGMMSESMERSGKTRFETSKVIASFRKSEVIEVCEQSQLDEKYLRYKKPEPDKTAIRQALKTGIEIPGVMLVTKRNLQIK